MAATLSMSKVSVRPEKAAPYRRPACPGGLGWSTVVCAASRRDVSSSSQANPVSQPVFMCAMAAAVSAMALMPFDASAVSGGGGLSDNLSGSDLSGKDLRKVQYTKANLRATNFNGANLTGVSLFSALAEKATFRDATLVLADLESGNFEDADFTNANLTGAFVNNAQFKNTIITNTDWTDVVLRKDMQKYLCKTASGTNPTTGVDTRESLVCAD